MRRTSQARLRALHWACLVLSQRRVAALSSHACARFQRADERLAKAAREMHARPSGAACQKPNLVTVRRLTPPFTVRPHAPLLPAFTNPTPRA